MSNHETDTKPTPGSYAEFHALVMNQILRFSEAHDGQVNLAAETARRLLADDIVGNLWQG
ncbi:hypothetical protein LCGC14_2518820, partial [marine sediment metagenome]